ncbi:hypothetical protein EVAR_9444_1 [Eumeta japonica]|uniref:Uncharacterized protein n=1 Tax=Eumeta variegata TaxID=151549 RepID=A0A4C1UEG6_EUMVA|nr:hypothetical protein EVAR_9444_1 [Eumeta japonica]
MAEPPGKRMSRMSLLPNYQKGKGPERKRGLSADIPRRQELSDKKQNHEHLPRNPPNRKGIELAGETRSNRRNGEWEQNRNRMWI